jgi:hypothetical protein
VNDPVTSLARARRRRFLACGIAILAIGLDVAAAMYHFQRPGDDEDPRTAAIVRSAAKADERQMGLLYGKGGARIFGWFDALTSPAGQAVMVALGSAAAAAICFRLAYVSKDAA